MDTINGIIFNKAGNIDSTINTDEVLGSGLSIKTNWIATILLCACYVQYTASPMFTILQRNVVANLFDLY